MKRYILSLGLIGLLIVISTVLGMAGGDPGDSGEDVKGRGGPPLAIGFNGGDPGDLGKAVKKTDFFCVPNDFAHISVEEVAAEFRALRKIRGHFDGGEWQDEADRWMGRKHRIMIKLASCLSGGKYKKGAVIKLLDPPDQVVRKGDALFEQILRRQGIDLLQQGNAASTVPSYEFLIYYWRGKHDFLFFTYQDSIVIDSGWWHAGE